MRSQREQYKQTGSKQLPGKTYHVRFTRLWKAGRNKNKIYIWRNWTIHPRPLHLLTLNKRTGFYFRRVKCTASPSNHQQVPVNRVTERHDGILPLVIPLFVVQFITTQVNVWCTLNQLPVAQIKMVWSHIVVYCMTNERKAYDYLFILVQVCHDLVFHNYIYTQMSQKLLIE